MELAVRFHEMNLIRVCLDVEQLPDMLLGLDGHSFAQFQSNTEALLTSLDGYIRSL